MLFKVQYIITRFIKKNFLVTMGVEPAMYVLNHNILAALPWFILLSQLLELNGETDSKLLRR